MTEAWLELEAHEIGDAAPGVRLLDLRAPGGGELPGFDAGAHVDVAVDDALVRQYSLCNDPRERHRYLLAVALAEPSRGGSRYLHERVVKGSRVRVGAPRNLFPLADVCAHSVLVAGGIGITPLWAMVQSLETAGASWELHYAARSREHAALLGTIQTFAARSRRGVLHCYFSREQPSRRIVLPALLSAAPAGTHFYGCASPGLLADFQAATAALPREQVHLERFESTRQAATAANYQVVLARSGLSIEVTTGQTVLDAVLAAGVSARYTCREGICGECETVVLEGVPDHRDEVLSEQERAANGSMMICCSGCRSGRLVLDL
ncbi:MAG: PDR/VanB family oxidoreductase [Pseudomonas sp.]